MRSRAALLKVVGVRVRCSSQQGARGLAWRRCGWRVQKAAFIRADTVRQKLNTRTGAGLTVLLFFDLVLRLPWLARSLA